MKHCYEAELWVSTPDGPQYFITVQLKSPLKDQRTFYLLDKSLREKLLREEKESK